MTGLVKPEVRSAPVGCLSDDTLIAHVGGALGAEQGERVRAHLDECDACRELAIVLAKGSGPGPIDLAATQVALTALRTATEEKPELPARFTIEKLLGQGGMGRVFAARDTELDRPVAVKVLRPDLESADLAERLLRESRLMARLNHPGVITIYDVGRTANRVWIAMELIAGPTLQGWLHLKDRHWHEVVEVFSRAGEGIAAAHAAGLVHRDIKPENILVALDGDRVKRVAVSDFGVARAAAGTPVTSMTETALGTRVGTPAYMAPEQLAAEPVDARADVFAFGVSMWEALFGARPYRGTSIAELETAMRGGVPATPKQANVPAWVVTAIRGAIEPSLAARTPTIEKVLAQLDLRRRSRRRTIAVVAGACVLGLGGVAFAVVPRVVPRTQPALCTGPGLANDWRDVLASAHAANNRAVAAGSAFAASWETVRGTTCKLDDVARRDAALACLDARRTALGELVKRVPEMTPQNLLRLDTIVEQLPSPATCATDAVLIRDVAPALRPYAAVLETRLAAASIRIATGGEADLVALAPQIAFTGSRALEAERLLIRAIANDDTTQFREAATAAAAAGRDDLAAKAWLEVANDAISKLDDAKRAADALALTDAAIVRGGEDPKLRTRYQLAQVQLDLLTSKFGDAAKLLEVVRARAPKDAPALVDDVASTGITLAIEQGKLPEAVTAARAAIADATQRLGPTHPRTIRAHNQLADALMQLGDMDSVLTEMRATLELVKRGEGPDSDGYGLGLRNLGVALDATGHTDDAITTLHQARAILVKTRGPRSFMVGDTYHDEATALSAANRFDAAIPLFEQAIAIYKDSTGEGHFHLAEALLSFAVTLEHTARKAEAVPTARAATAVILQLYGADSAKYGSARSSLGETLIHAGDKPAARVELEAALAIDNYRAGDPALVNATRFNLAQALIADPGQRDRAMGLANEALGFFRTAGPQWQDVVQSIQFWIKRGGLD